MAASASPLARFFVMTVFSASCVALLLPLYQRYIETPKTPSPLHYPTLAPFGVTNTAVSPHTAIREDVDGDIIPDEDDDEFEGSQLKTPPIPESKHPSQPKIRTTSKDADAVTITEVLLPADCEPRARRGDRLIVHYTGFVKGSAEIVDTTRKLGRSPIVVQLGARHMIPGWEEGLLDMCPGEKRDLEVPPSKGYAQYGFGDTVPPNATLLFQVELLGFDKKLEESWSDRIQSFLPILLMFVFFGVRFFRTTREAAQQRHKQRFTPTPAPASTATATASTDKRRKN